MSLFKSALCAALCLLAVGSASATPILDQQNTVMSSQLNGGSVAYAWQQGITAGLTGQLTTIEVFAFGTAGTTQLFVNLGAPWQSDVNDWSTVALINPGWNSFDLTTANIFLHAGDQFVLGFHDGSRWCGICERWCGNDLHEGQHELRWIGAG